MIRWCSYCQVLLGEIEPLTNYGMTHGICGPCDERLEHGEELTESYDDKLTLFRAIVRAALHGDASTCRALAERSAEQGISNVSLLVGLLQPALEQLGADWEKGRVSCSEEHRFSTWCETMFSLLERPAAPAGPIDILIVPAPGNRHEIGPRFAELALLEQGVKAEVIVPDLPVDEVYARLLQRQARWLGISCSLVSSQEDVKKMIDDITARGFRGDFIVSGQAPRRAPDEWQGLNASVCRTLEAARSLIVSGRPP